MPENHSAKDYIQVLTSEEDSMEIETGSYHYVPAGKHGQITISTKDVPSTSIIRFVYVKTGARVARYRLLSASSDLNCR